MRQRYYRLLSRHQTKRRQRNRRPGGPRSLQTKLAAEQVFPPIERHVQPVIHAEFLE
jgi:hypothetical protein